MVSSSSSSALLTLRYATLEDVAQDLDMVVQSSSEGGWSWDGASAQEQEAWEQFVQDPASISASKTVGLAGKVEVVKGISLSFSLVSHSRDEGEEHEATVDVSAPSLPPEKAARLKNELSTRSEEWKEEGMESLYLFDLLATAQTLVADLPSHPQADTPADISDLAPLDPSQAPLKSSTQIELSRALFWSHHLKAPSKLKDFNNWCPELGIWGIVRVGWPGYLCFEGEASSVNEMVRRVKGLQWHAIQLRVQTNWTVEAGKHKDKRGRSPLEEALLSCPLAKGHPDNAFQANDGEGKIRTGCQVIENLGELVARLKGCGLAEDDIETVLGIHISTGG